MKPPIVAVFIGLPMAIRGFVYRRHRLEDVKVDRSLWLFVGLWLALEMAGAIAQRRMYAYHFFPLAAPAALMMGMIPRKNSPGALLSALAPLAIFSVYTAAIVVKYEYRRASGCSERLSHRAHERGDAVWQDDAPRLLLETGLRPGSRFVLTFLFLNHDNAADGFCKILLDDLEQRRPKYVVSGRTWTSGWRIRTSIARSWNCCR